MLKGFHLSLLASLLLCLLCFQSARAAFPPPQGWYIEGNTGLSTVNSKSYDAPNVRRSGVGFNANLGYKLTTFFSGEIGYTHYFPTRIYNGPKLGQDNHYSYDAAVKATVPISDTSVEAFGKLGVARLHTDVQISNTQLAQGLNLYPGANNVTGLYMALGLAYYFAPSIGVNIQWAQANGNSNTGNLVLYSAGLSYFFG